MIVYHDWSLSILAHTMIVTTVTVRLSRSCTVTVEEQRNKGKI